MTDVIRKDVQKRLENGDFSCAKELTLSMISGKWKIVILNELGIHGPYRFNELMHLMPRVTHKVLTNQLRELAEDGLITRVEEKAAPVKVFYAITPVGRSLLPIIQAMTDWGEARIQATQIVPRFSLDEAVVAHKEIPAKH
ncbi:winged helix-turn-helix transcriptional regulator [Schleiferilactobacillus shenzhenensis]|uniref:HxlR n=1 Tax=Schleiferilactobacillus shenzhenensis LY-73 TaxID=1231336 RepID=U4TKP0_9LACO|nr:helix-turn-helix domain-containing protein [Schleiferilactobacillus shenzhenensis]ERL63930.1 HxlR [Schleiferilactobacillus shenzhenensis LY-73]